MAEEKRINPVDFEPNVAVGLDLPLVEAPNSFFKLNYTTAEQVKTDLKNLILTQKGERYMLPDYGTNLRRSLFEQSDTAVISITNEEIRGAVLKWLPIVLIDDIIIEQDTRNEHLYYITIKYSTQLDVTEIDELEVELITG